MSKKFSDFSVQGRGDFGMTVKKEHLIGERTNVQECTDEVTAIMIKYNCYFSPVTIIENGCIVSQTLIKERPKVEDEKCQ